MRNYAGIDILEIKSSRLSIRILQNAYRNELKEYKRVLSISSQKPKNKELKKYLKRLNDELTRLKSDILIVYEYEKRPK